MAAAEEARALGDMVIARSRSSASHVAGLAHAGLGRPQEARRAFETAIADIEALREQVSGAEVERQQFLEANVAPYHSLIDLLIEQGQYDEALRYAERARARTLLDVVERGHVALNRWLTPSEREEERTLERKLRALQRGAPSGGAATSGAAIGNATAATKAVAATTGAASTAAESLAATRRELAALRVRLFAAHPELQLARGEAAMPARAELSTAIVDPSAAVLSYTLTGRRAWLFVITANTMKVHALKVDASALTARGRAFREAIGTRDLGFAAEARALYDELIAPAADTLKGKTRLILVPDGALWELPFQALRSPGRRYLLEDVDVAYAPSLTFLYVRHMRANFTAARDPPAPLDLLALGNPTLAAHEASAFKPLPSAEAQARRVAALYPADRTLALTGAAAREATVKRDASRYRVLHFATHGVVDDGNPLYSALLLAEGPADTDASEDGRLEARELMDIPLDADLVVLSACDTARGRIGAGEGVVGLSWAILLAGSASTVVSQWQVDAESTSSLMIGFYRALLTRTRTGGGANGTSGPTRVSTALRRASLNLMRDPRYQHPFYWASFRVVGAP